MASKKSSSRTSKNDEKGVKRSPKRARIEIKDDVDEDADTILCTKNNKIAPKDWQLVLSQIRAMRADRSAPVDSMGCERAHDERADPRVQRFQCLVSLMLSSQTKDEVNHAAMQRLIRRGLQVRNILDMNTREIEELIKPVGFWRRKAEYLKRTAAILHEKYNDDIPDSVEKLCELPGVGPKMAHLAMNIAWKQQSGIGVDTHVHRISQRLGWVGSTRTPEETREALEEWLPKELWTEINWLLVGFGQERCVPISPFCADCLCNSICPFGIKQVKSGKARSLAEKQAK